LKAASDFAGLAAAPTARATAAAATTSRVAASESFVLVNVLLSLKRELPGGR
jgi:hypothetical protein